MKTRQMKIIGCVCSAVFLMAFPLPALGEAWGVIYQTDFAVDPGWQTSNPSDYYWEAGTATYFSRQVDGPGHYSYIQIPGFAPAQPWRLEYDIYVISMAWCGNGRVSLTNSSMCISGPPGVFVTLDFNSTNQLQLLWRDSLGGESYVHLPGWALDTWYTARVEWNPGLSTLTATVWERDSGALHGQAVVSAVGPFTSLDRIAMSAVCDSYCPGATGEIRVDNVRLLQPTTVPAVSEWGVLAMAALMLAAGAVVVSRRRAVG